MGFAQDSGYTPDSIETILDAFRVDINTQFGTSYTTDSFIGSNHYKYYYAISQRVEKNEIKTSEIFAYLQQYITITNEAISRPVVTSPGLVAKLEAEGYVASVKPMVEADAGKIFVCVDTDDGAPTYAATKLDICTIIANSTVAGCVTMGTESEAIVIDNGQSFDFKFNLPNRINVLLRLTLTLSENNQSVIKSPEDIKSDLLLNIAIKYGLGKNFEPQKYYGNTDAPWASDILLEWSDDDGANYQSTVYDADYDDLFTIPLENIELIED